MQDNSQVPGDSKWWAHVVLFCLEVTRNVLIAASLWGWIELSELRAPLALEQWLPVIGLSTLLSSRRLITRITPWKDRISIYEMYGRTMTPVTEFFADGVHWKHRGFLAALRRHFPVCCLTYCFFVVLWLGTGAIPLEAPQSITDLWLALIALPLAAVFAWFTSVSRVSVVEQTLEIQYVCGIVLHRPASQTYVVDRLFWGPMELVQPTGRTDILSSGDVVSDELALSTATH